MQVVICHFDRSSGHLPNGTSMKALTLLATTIFLLFSIAPAAHAGIIAGKVSDESGRALSGVNVCLLPAGAVPGSDRVCLRQNASNGQGRYRFRMNKPGAYAIEIRDERFETYVWNAVATHAVIKTRDQDIRGLDFKRQFRFGNFRNQMTITADHLPELFTRDLVAMATFVKLYVADAASTSGQKLLFLGRVTDVAQLAIKLSLPSTAQAIQYEVFGQGLNASGTIPVVL
ncbi:carboxypeptidase-like regulatory domain-containing protein [Methylolobus aquaticus]